jgi:hypothetical protein
MLKLIFAEKNDKKPDEVKDDLVRDCGAVSKVTHGTTNAPFGEGGQPPYNTSWGGEEP